MAAADDAFRAMIETQCLSRQFLETIVRDRIDVDETGLYYSVDYSRRRQTRWLCNLGDVRAMATVALAALAWRDATEPSMTTPDLDDATLQEWQDLCLAVPSAANHAMLDPAWAAEQGIQLDPLEAMPPGESVPLLKSQWLRAAAKVMIPAKFDYAIIETIGGVGYLGLKGLNAP